MAACSALNMSVYCWLTEILLAGTVQLNRSLPWRQPTNERRKAEQVRPIFWANRPKSYINRTSDWDKYPQGRYACGVVSHLLACYKLFLAKF